MISLLLVNYRSSLLAAEAIRTARAAASSPIEVVVVDNSCDAGEAEALRTLADTLVVSDTNRGYAGGINLGRRSCSGKILIVTNPDVVFAGDAIDRLAAALHRAAAAGPALYWDAAHRWILPPGDPYTAGSRLDALLAGRSRAWQAMRDRRRFLQRVAFWSSEGPSRVPTLSGAVMAIRAEAFDDLEGFDERFPLYFEETDFLRRLTVDRKEIVYVPAARCRHLHNQSAVQIPVEAATRFAQSESRYLDKWNGPLVSRVIKRLERPWSSPNVTPIDRPLAIDRAGVVVEASPLSSFDTAAGYFPREGELEVDVPENAWTAPVIYLRSVVRSTGQVLATYERRRT